MANEEWMVFNWLFLRSMGEGAFSPNIAVMMPTCSEISESNRVILSEILNGGMYITFKLLDKHFIETSRLDLLQFFQTLGQEGDLRVETAEERSNFLLFLVRRASKMTIT